MMFHLTLVVYCTALVLHYHYASTSLLRYWYCTVSGMVLSLYFDRTTRVLLVRQWCRGIVLPSRWYFTNTALVPCWHFHRHFLSTGLVLEWYLTCSSNALHAYCWYSIVAMALHLHCVGTTPALRSYHLSTLIGTSLLLGWYWTGTKLVLRSHCTRTHDAILVPWRCNYTTRGCYTGTVLVPCWYFH